MSEDNYIVKYDEKKEMEFNNLDEAFVFYEQRHYPKALWDNKRMELLACVDENGKDYC